MKLFFLLLKRRSGIFLNLGNEADFEILVVTTVCCLGSALILTGRGVSWKQILRAFIFRCMKNFQCIVGGVEIQVCENFSPHGM
ncbi:hypothetical protein M2447_002038 [Ereboglobus sp. PH5-10]|uniref:hypothetical protein n=1 Tax=Ereboglobus sp. PH5-10 TaxID=2940629 RepID=UPI002405265E|nr:hypothetical protein [Ereboglobus sp. PH5-10]MDF9827933.1 hypothetical protein [Ereboglobus sp. PH5-10]